MNEKSLRRKVQVKAIACALLLAVCVAAGAFTALVQPSRAAHLGSRAVFTRRYDSTFASARSLSLQDPFTGRQFTVSAGLPFLYADNNAGVYAYCIQKGQEIFDTGSITRSAFSLYDPMFYRLSAAAKENIALVSLFGYPNCSAAQLGASQTAAHAATQLLLWEAALGYRNAAFARTDGRIAAAYFAGGANAAAEAVYDAIVLRISAFLRVPSFLQRQPLVLELTYDPAGGLYMQRFTDTNGSNASLAVAGRGAEISILREGNDYVFTSKQRPARTQSLTIERTDVPEARTDALGQLLVWVDLNCGADNQLLLSGVQPRKACWQACLMPVPETTTLPEPTTDCPKPTTTLPEPTTDCPKPTTTLPEPTTDCPKPTTTLPEPSTDCPKPTTTLPKPTTDCPKPTTTLPEPTTNCPKPTATLPEPTTDCPKPTTVPPKPTTTCTETVTQTCATTEKITSTANTTTICTTSTAIITSACPPSTSCPVSTTAKTTAAPCTSETTRASTRESTTDCRTTTKTAAAPSLPGSGVPKTGSRTGLAVLSGLILCAGCAGVALTKRGRENAGR